MTIYKRAISCMVIFTTFATYTWAQTANPYILNAESKPYLLRSYLMFEGKKRTHVISVGTPEKINYAYDLKQGALLQLWHGQFMDVTEMWKDRGEPQLAKPLGTVLSLSAAPAVAALADQNTDWPDSIGFDDFLNKGYVLDKNRMPAFLYSSNGADIADKIDVLSGGGGIERTISISNSKTPLYCRIAAAPVIKALKDDTYSIGNNAYTIKVPAKSKAFIRKTANGQELLAQLANGTDSLTYSLIW